MKRISLWSGPRNVSTAIMYSFAQRPDTRVVDEPLYGHYLQVSGAQHPGREEVLAHMELSGDKVVAQLINDDFERPILFIKNMAHHLLHLDRAFLPGLHNLLLIRDPKEMIPSLVNQIPQPQMIDTAYKMQWDLYEQLVDLGQSPTVIDSRELLLAPENILRQVCEKTAISYYPEMTSWQPGPRPEDGIWAPHWYHQVHKSTGFAPYKPKEESVRSDLQPLLKECQYYYDLLFAEALKHH